MNKLRLSLAAKIFLLSYSVLGVSLSLNGSDVFEASNTESPNLELEENDLLQQKNMQRAKELIETLYVVNYETFDKFFGEEDVSEKVGTQAGYYGKEGTDQAYSPLVIYRRVWIYDAAIALSLAIQNEDPTTDERALWLFKNGQYTRDPDNSAKAIFAGWPFSANQKIYGDNWTDCRFVNGANAYGIQAIADYIMSDYYLKLNNEGKASYTKLYEDALHGILYHMESDGPNKGLLAAGWSLNVLEDFSKTNYSYNKILDMFGYGPVKMTDYTEPIRRVRARNVVTEHNNNLLAVLNYALKHYDRLFKSNSQYTYNKLNEIRTNLRETIFSKLYDSDKGNFVTGRSVSGELSPYTAIDNIAWLVLSLELDELNDEQVTKLSKSLKHSIKTFTKEFNIAGETYYGAHYFEDGFEDPYIRKSNVHSDALYVEATCGLICGLLQFANTFPDDSNSSLFRSTAAELWKSMQRFINDFGFVYASSSLKDVTEPIEASASAIWYLRTCNYIEAISGM